MKELDKKDKQILFELDRDSRQSVNDIARKTKLSRDVVRYRINQLEKEDYIKGYIALIDFTKLGYQIVRLYLKLQNTTLQIEEEMMKFLLNEDSVIIAYRTDGNYELAIGFLVKDFRDYQKTYDALLTKYRHYIVEKNFSIFSDYLQYYRNYLVNENKRDFNELSTGSFEQFNYDNIDIKILKEISTNARESLIDMSKKINIPVTTIKYRLDSLRKKKVIVAYRTIINYHKMGHEYYKVDITLEDLSAVPALSEFVKTHPNILYRDVAIGGSDFEFDCELKGQQEFYKLMESIKEAIPKKIRSFFYYKAIKIHKYSYFPRLILKNENFKD